MYMIILISSFDPMVQIKSVVRVTRSWSFMDFLFQMQISWENEKVLVNKLAFLVPQCYLHQTFNLDY